MKTCNFFWKNSATLARLIWFLPMILRVLALQSAYPRVQHPASCRLYSTSGGSFDYGRGSTTGLLNSIGDKNDHCKSIVICGPSGVGKGTIISHLLKSYPSKFGLSVSHTSRKPRPGEVDGVHYHFISDRTALLDDIATGPVKYIEHAEVHSNIYGTRADAVAAVHAAGKLCILDLDSNGVKQIIDCGFPAKRVFIAPPTVAALEQRLRSRDTESEEQIQLRLRNAIEEINYGTDGIYFSDSSSRNGSVSSSNSYSNSNNRSSRSSSNFDLVLYNGDLQETIDEFYAQLCAWFPDELQRSEQLI